MRNDSTPPAGFPTTHWSRVAHAVNPAAPEARAALAELCGAYWYPIYAFIRRQGHGSEAALDLTQEYFARLLEQGVLGSADQRKGRFRAFLRTDCGYFLADQHDRDRALKRGGGTPPLPIDARDAEGRYLIEPSDHLTPDHLFDRAWAVALLGGVLERLAGDYRKAGRLDLFEALQSCLVDDSDAESYAAIAARFKMTEPAVQQAAARLRKRYRVTLRDHIAATLDHPDESAIQDEVHALFAALA